MPQGESYGVCGKVNLAVASLELGRSANERLLLASVRAQLALEGEFLRLKAINSISCLSQA